MLHQLQPPRPCLQRLCQLPHLLLMWQRLQADPPQIVPGAALLLTQWKFCVIFQSLEIVSTTSPSSSTPRSTSSSTSHVATPSSRLFSNWSGSCLGPNTVDISFDLSKSGNCFNHPALVFNASINFLIYFSCDNAFKQTLLKLVRVLPWS